MSSAFAVTAISIDALYERKNDIQTVSVRHESVAGFMADVYYRVSGQPTATFTSCGPGSANLPISLANAFLDSAPFMAVTGNVPTSQFNRGAFQELYRPIRRNSRKNISLYQMFMWGSRGAVSNQCLKRIRAASLAGSPGERTGGLLWPGAGPSARETSLPVAKLCYS